MKKLLTRLVQLSAGWLGFVPAADVRERLQYSRSIGKRLDEHREVVEQIDLTTKLFQECPWHVWHMATQDDYLMRLYFMVHGSWPDDKALGGGVQNTGEFVRPRPTILGPCQLPELIQKGYSRSVSLSLNAR